MDIIQLRDKGSAGEQQWGPLEARDELAALEVLADAARRHGAMLAVNDRADIARAAGADVLHLGQDDLPLPVARDIVGPDVLIGRSAHDHRQVAAADCGGRRLLLRRAVLADPHQTRAPGTGAAAGAVHRGVGPRQTVVRHRRNRRGSAAGSPGGRRAARRGGARDHRRAGSAGRSRAAPFGARLVEQADDAQHQAAVFDLDRACQIAPRLTTRSPRHDLQGAAQPVPTGREPGVQR